MSQHTGRDPTVSAQSLPPHRNRRSWSRTQRANLFSPPSPRAETAGSAKTRRPARPAHDQDQKSPAGPNDAPVGPKQERWTMTVRRCRYLRRACHSQSADPSSGNEAVRSKHPEIVPSHPLQNLSRSLADLDEMRIATLPRIALRGVSQWVGKSRPPCLSQVRRRIPVPAPLHSTTPTMIIFGLPTRQPTTCLSWKLDTQYVVCTHLQVPGPRITIITS